MTYLDGSHTHFYTYDDERWHCNNACNKNCHPWNCKIDHICVSLLLAILHIPIFISDFFCVCSFSHTLIFVFAIQFIVSTVFDFEHRFSVIIKFIYPVANSFDTSHVWLLGFREQKLIVSIGLRASIMNSEINTPIWVA